MSKPPPDPSDTPLPNVSDDPPINHLHSISLVDPPTNRRSVSLTAFQMSLQKRDTKLNLIKNAVSSSTTSYAPLRNTPSQHHNRITDNNSIAMLHNSLHTNNEYVPVNVTQDSPHPYQHTQTTTETHQNQLSTDVAYNSIQTKKLNCELLYHQDETHYVLSEFCHPVSSTNVNTTQQCRYGRDCLVLKWKILEGAVQHSELSPTTYTPPVNEKEQSKYIYDLVDTRYVTCFRKCTSKNSTQPKYFHHVCYMHNMNKSKVGKMNHIQVSNDDKFTLRLVNQSLKQNNTNSRLVDKDAPDGMIKLILPVCGKRCSSNVMRDVNNTMTKMMSSPTIGDGSSKINWDNDGGNGKRSSIQVLVDWITTEENCTFYYGGKLKKGQTCGQRKEGFHYLIAEEIRKENSKFIVTVHICTSIYVHIYRLYIYIYIYKIILILIVRHLYSDSIRSPASIKSRIDRLLESFKAADARFKKTGAGIHDFTQFRSFHDSVLKKHCRWYHELYAVFHDRPNVNAAYTNEEEDDSSSLLLEDDESLVSDSNSRNSDIEVVDCFNTSNSNSNNMLTSDNSTSDSFNFSSNLERHSTTQGKKHDLPLTNATVVVNKQNDSTSATKEVHTAELNKEPEVQVVPMSPTPVTPKTCESPTKKAKLTPSQAQHIQKGLISNKKKQVRGKGRKGTGVFWNTKEEEEREVLMECRRTKMKLDQQRHEDIKMIESKKLLQINKIEEKKITLDEQRLQLESKSIELKMKRESVLYSQERKNLMLLNMKIFKERQEMKLNDPSLTDEKLDKLFPMDLDYN
jgi:hypothetical protein